MARSEFLVVHILAIVVSLHIVQVQLKAMQTDNELCSVGNKMGVCKSVDECSLGNGTNIGTCPLACCKLQLEAIQPDKELCSVGNTVGDCKSLDECYLGNGINMSPCPLACCKYVYTCGNTTSERVSYFTNPSVFTEYCKLSVNVYDRSVTQLRLDFETFSLSQPTKSNSPIDTRAYFCQNDTFRVITSAAYSNLGFDVLCGENSGQHIYVPVNATLGPATVDLIFHLVNRINNSNGGFYPRWNIKITQIDCCAPDTRYLCAPEGCLQYYPARSGTFESFNFNGGNGHYQGLLNYAICFRRYDNICSIRYNALRFQLAADDLTDSYGTAGCNVATISADNPNSRDYLFIPDAYLASGVNSALFCGTILENDPASTNAPGPMYVFFRTDQYAYQLSLGEEIGFRIQYQVDMELKNVLSVGATSTRRPPSPGKQRLSTPQDLQYSLQDSEHWHSNGERREKNIYAI